MSLLSGLFDRPNDDNSSDIFSSSRTSSNDSVLGKRKGNFKKSELRTQASRIEMEAEVTDQLTINASSQNTISEILNEYGLVVFKELFKPDEIRPLKEPAEELLSCLESKLKRRKINYKNSSSIYENFAFTEVAGRQSGRIDSRLGLPKTTNQTVAPEFYGSPSTPCTLSLSEITGNKQLQKAVEKILGSDATLTYAGLIYSFPGSEDQNFHQDGIPLFPDDLDLQLPPYALNVFIPVHELSRDMGLTEFFPSSNKAAEFNRLSKLDLIRESTHSSRSKKKVATIQPLLSVGDALFYDYRVCHRGVANRSQFTRTMLYVMYSRPWLKEHINFDDTKSLFD